MFSSLICPDIFTPGPICPALTRRNAILILLGASIQTTTPIQTTTSTAMVLTLPSFVPASACPLELALEFPAKSIVEHATGWTLFKDLYNGTFFILTETPSDFAEIRKMMSKPMYVLNTPRKYQNARADTGIWISCRWQRRRDAGVTTSAQGGRIG
ncbi:hypothetical protein MVEN_01109700 [Mycena venus]|uniref:Uncharacterized protein n=1 Tax=Mycena venus TaxID=2733690 RepID=A0A8H7CXS1_9AGAR|nr:hypothetical protein MVEN_01109700 [Mycena venus]